MHNPLHYSNVPRANHKGLIIYFTLSDTLFSWPFAHDSVTAADTLKAYFHDLGKKLIRKETFNTLINPEANASELLENPEEISKEMLKKLSAKGTIRWMFPHN